MLGPELASNPQPRRVPERVLHSIWNPIEGEMSETFNPYREWLGIEHCPQPNFYQLLGLAAGESDADKIVAAADRATTKIRSLDPGGQVPARSQLLAEIQSAKSCLLDPVKRAEYNLTLKGKSNAAPSSPNFQTKSAPSGPDRPKALPRAKLLVPNGPHAIPNAPKEAPANLLSQDHERVPHLPPGIPTAVLPGSSQPTSSVPVYPYSWQRPAWGAQTSGSYGQPYAQPGSPAPAAVPPNYPGTCPTAFPAGPFPTPTVGPQADPMLPYNPYYVPAQGTAPAYSSPCSYLAPPQCGGVELVQQRVVSRAAVVLAARRRQETRNLLI